MNVVSHYAFAMKSLIALLLIMLSVIFTEVNAQSRSDVVEQPHLQAQFLTEVVQIQPGDSFWTVVKLIPDDGWHTYWINPGDSGLATQIQWQLENGVTAGDIKWPVASKYRIGPLANYGFEDTTYLLVQVDVAEDFTGDSLTLENRVDWLVCEEYCIPGFAEFKLTLDVGSTTSVAEENQQSFTAARANLPTEHSWPAQFDVQGSTVTIIIEHPDAVAMAAADNFYAYVGAGELVEHAESGDVSIVDDAVIIRRTRNTYFSGVDSEFPLLLTAGQVTAEQTAVLLQATASDANTSSASSVPADAATGISLALVLLFAFLGGLILNLMPCVFPVLSLKALSVANSQDRKLADSLFYTLGVIATFVLIAALLLVLRASGAALGWGFQLQNPWLIALLTLLFVTIGLNLSGVFQMATSAARLANMSGAANASKPSTARGSFATGVLAVIIASPCTAPFMGVALGFAIVQPPAIALLIFAVLGLGLAFPFLLLALIPGVSNLLPKPGAWMDTFKQWMAIPMYLTTVWLLWVFSRQAGADSQALLLVAIVLLASALWLIGKRQLQSRKDLSTLLVLAVFLLLTALALFSAMNMRVSGAAQPVDSSRNWQSWSPQVLADAREQGPVFVNMTADWCITCLANERVALETESTRALFSDYGITYLKGDWTLQDSQITEYLAQYERNGVPLYVLYWPGQDPVVLPQILTTTIVRDRVRALADN